MRGDMGTFGISNDQTLNYMTCSWRIQVELYKVISLHNFMLILYIASTTHHQALCDTICLGLCIFVYLSVCLSFSLSLTPLLSFPLSLPPSLYVRVFVCVHVCVRTCVWRSGW